VGRKTLTQSISSEHRVWVYDVVLLLRLRRERWRSIVMNTYVCVCVSVCLSLCPRLSPEPTRSIFTNSCACCLWPWLCHPPAWWLNPKGKGQLWGFSSPIDNALYGPYRDMNFATKHRFGLNLLIYRKLGHNSISEY